MTPTGTCKKCARRYTGWALEQNLTCPECGGGLKVMPKPSGWKPASGYMQENDPRYEEVKDE